MADQQDDEDRKLKELDKLRREKEARSGPPNAQRVGLRRTLRNTLLILVPILILIYLLYPREVEPAEIRATAAHAMAGNPATGASLIR